MLPPGVNDSLFTQLYNKTKPETHAQLTAGQTQTS